MTKEQIKKKLNLDKIYNFQEGRAAVEKNNKWGHVDLDGKVTTPIVYEYVSSFKEGRAWVQKNGKWGHVDLDGKVVVLIIYDEVGYFSRGGRAWVEINSIEFNINKNGYPLKHKDFYKLIKGLFK